MSKNKKEIRRKFRDDCFKRDNFKCAVCGFNPEHIDDLDAHHITDRNEIPNGGYVKENGITLCIKCHLAAEVYHQTGVAQEGYSPEDLYKIIDSSKEKAIQASLKH